MSTIELKRYCCDRCKRTAGDLSWHPLHDDGEGASQFLMWVAQGNEI